MTQVLRWAIFGLWLCLAGMVFAQSGAPDFQTWGVTAQRAEAAIENGQASDTALSGLRTELSTWRQIFSDARSTNAARPKTLNAQLTALGPAPAEGQIEDDVIAIRRAELLSEIKRLDTPRRSAVEAFTRADGLIDEIDALLDGRQATQLTARGPSPLNPQSWGSALGALVSTINSLIGGVQSAIASPAQRQEAQTALPFAVLMAVLGGLLIFKSRDWLMRLARPVLERESNASEGLARFLATFGSACLSVLAVFLLIQGAEALGFYGPKGAAVLSNLTEAAIYFFAAVWLSGVARGAEFASRGFRRAVLIAGGVLAARTLLNPLFALDGYTAQNTGVLEFMFVAVMGFALFRIGRNLQIRTPMGRDADLDTTTNLSDLLRQYAGLLTVCVAIAGPVLAALGYSVAATRLIFPTAITLGGLAFLLVLFEAVRDAYAWIRGMSERTTESLIPIFINAVLCLVSLPVFALVWGVRETSLFELWTTFSTGVQLGETTISPGAFFTLILVFIVGYFITRVIQRALATNVLPRTNIDPGGQTAMVSGVGYVGIFLAALVAITSAGLNLSSLAIVAGALSVGIGFGLQNIVSNFVSGIILLIERPISEGDWIEVGGHMGYVRDISVRSTRIETFDKTDVIVPNADFVSGTVTNYTRGNTTGRIIVPVGVAYGSDTRKIQEMLLEIAEAHPMVLLNPGPSVVFQGFGADSLDFEIRAILRDVTWGLTVKTEINHQINEAFTKHGIEIPYAQRDIWIRNPEALPGNSEGENS